MSSSKYIPRTADGQPVYPGMPVFVCAPYSVEKVGTATVYSVGHGESSETNDYDCVLAERRYFDGERWIDGNTEHVRRLYADESECLRAADEKYAQFARERLHSLRQKVRAERVSYDDILELRYLAEYIDPGDTELLELAGVPENTDEATSEL